MTQLPKLSLGQLAAIIAFVAPIAWGGFNAYRDIGMLKDRVAKMEEWIEKEEDFRRQEELLRRFGEVDKLKLK